MRKRITAILLVLCMCMNLLPDVFEPQEVYAEEDTVVETGSCGENATYTVYSSGYAVVEGTGEAELCTSSNFDILIIESGITKISSIYTFYGSTLMLNEGLEVIGSGVIGPYIEELTVPSTVTEFEVNSLIQHQIKEITFLGKKPKMLIECFGLEGPQHQITAYYPEGEWAQADFQYLNAVTTWIPCTWADGKRIPDESQKYTVSKWVPQVRETGSCGANAYYTMYDEGTLIIEGTGYIEERTWNTAKWVEVKEGITGLADPEYHIYDNGIFNEGHYPGYKETVLLPSTLEYIGNGAFYCCEALKNIGITKNVKAVGESAFESCESLEEINLENAKTIGTSAFAYCESLQSITLADGVEIGTGAFCNCPNLSEIIYKGAPPVFERNTFAIYETTDDMSDCSDITVYYPENAGWSKEDMQYIDRETTYYVPYTLDANGNIVPHTDRMTVVKFEPQSSGTFDAGGEWYIEDDILYIRGAYNVTPGEEIDYADHWMNIKGLVVEPGVTYFNFWFRKYKKLKTVVFSTSYCSGCEFTDCDSLESIDLPNRVAENGEAVNYFPAIERCNSLKSLIIPASVNEISKIEYCENLEEIIFLGDAPEFSEYAIRKVGEVKFYYPADNATWTEVIRSKGYGATVTWIPYTLDANGKRIADMSKAQTVISKVIIDNSTRGGLVSTVYSNGTMTIEGEGGIDSDYLPNLKMATRLEIGEGFTEIESNAFDGMGSEQIESITLPSTLTSIGQYAFVACDNLKTIDMSKATQLTELGEGCFCSSGLETITLPNGLKKIPTNAFASTNLKSIVIPDSVTEIGDEAFRECNKLESVHIGKGVARIGYSAFCLSGIKSIDIPANVKEISYEAFNDCSNLESVTFHEGLERIGDGAFASTGIKNIVLPESVIDLAYINSSHTSGGSIGTFYGCQNLVSVKLPSNLDSIPKSCFSNCKNLQNVELPKKLTYMDQDAFLSTGIKEITFPSTLNIIQDGSFAMCDKLEKVIFTGKVSTINWGAFSSGNSEAGKIVAYVPKELEEFYTEDYFNMHPDIVACHPYIINKNGTYEVENTIAESKVKEKITAAKKLYPEGYSLNQYSVSVLNGVVGGKVYPIGFGSRAFAYILSDYIFEDRTIEFDRKVSFEEVRVGDILCIDNGSRAVVVTEKRANDVVVAQGDWKGTVHWGEVVSKATVEKASYRITRYRRTTFSMAYELSTIICGDWEDHFPTLPTTMPTEKEAYKRMMKAQASMPEGYPFSEEIIYDLNADVTEGVMYTQGKGSAAFCYMLSDMAFGKADIRNNSRVAMDAIMVGDILELRTDTETESVIVLEVYKDSVVVAQGDYNGKVCWKRVLSKEEIEERALSHYTRYSKGTKVPERDEREKIEVKKVKLNKSKLNLLAGKTYTLKATITPSNAEDKKLTWSSSNKKIATVDKNGKVKGLKAGTVTITAKAANGKKATCKVTVVKASLNATSVPLQVKKTVTLKATSNLSGDKVKSWKSSDKKVATVSSKGVVKGIKAGKATITVTMNSGATAKCTVTVQKGKVTTKKLILDQKKVTLQKGKTTTLKVTRNPISASEKITWKSSNKKVATVDKNGKVKGIKAGTATITATSSNNKKVTCKVTVKNPSVKLEKTKATIKVGKTTTIKIKSTFPANDKVKSYTSSNKKVATVDKKGKVKGIKAGKATITVKMKSGAKVKFTVTVKK